VTVMPPADEAITRAYLQHLSPRDLDLLVGGAAAGAPPDLARHLARLPEGLDGRLGDPSVFDALFGPPGKEEPLVGASPFLAFAVAVHRCAQELASMSYVTEWLGPGRHAPVFDVAQLRSFLDVRRNRFFLAELLHSYTHVASGSVFVRTRRGLRRQRFSELDPVRLAGLLDVVSETERPGVLRRLGDLALFLTGVFPDYVSRRGFAPIEEGRLLRAGGMPGGGADRRPGAGAPGPAIAEAAGPGGAVGLLELLGMRWYRAAFLLLPRPVPEDVAVIGDLPAHFGQARRILGLVTERFLFHQRDRWFGPRD
jgi:hypothetical protein